MFSDHPNIGLYSLNVHVQNYVLKDFRAFDTLLVFDSSLLEQYIVKIKYTYRHISRRMDTNMNERTKIVGCRTNWKQTDLRMLSLKGEREVVKCKLDGLLQDVAYLVDNDENFLLDHL